MNYIQRLQSISEDRANRLEAMFAKVEELRQHLQSDKFKGQDVDGARKDWIATADVLRWVEEIRRI